MSTITEQLDETLDHLVADLLYCMQERDDAAVKEVEKEARTRLQALMLRERISELRPFTEKPFTDGIMAMREEIAAYSEGCIARLTEQLTALEGNTQEGELEYDA